MAIATGVTCGITAQLAPEYRPFWLVNAVIGIFVALLAHYQLARYESLDEDVDDLPDARVRSNDARS
jgi:hypothetical protein